MAKLRSKKKKNEKKNSKNQKKRREQIKLAMRRNRAKLTNEEIEERRRKDRERYKERKMKGLVTHIEDLPPRSQKAVRQKWKENSKRYRDNKKQQKVIAQQADEQMKNNTPPSSSQPSIAPSSSRSRADSGKKIAQKNKRNLKLENALLKSRLREIEKRMSKYKMRYNRMRAKLTSSSTVRSEASNEAHKTKINNMKLQIKEFLEKDESSRLTAGKKETITKKKIKKQIRLLNDTMLNLYAKFKNTVNRKISYSLFCRYRPFWIISPDAKKRDTCLCVQHENMEQIVSSLKMTKILKETTSVNFVKSICCEGKLNEDCLMRNCEGCRNKKVQIMEIENANDTISYWRWITKKVPISIKRSEKMCHKTVKERVYCSKTELLELFQAKLPGFMNHLNNIFHQYHALNCVKRQINNETALLNIDFSENYICKYASEVESAHFGGSKPQISLHTAVLYHYHDVGESDTISSYCTISENLRHDPTFICAHLLPIIKIIKDLHPDLKTMHFLSDGPSTQYRNKSKFFLLANFISAELGVQNVMWHYHESGHGKGAPDGIGATVKRTADRMVAMGRDVGNFQQLTECLNGNCKGVQVIPIDEKRVEEIESLLKKSNTSTLKGTQGDEAALNVLPVKFAGIMKLE